jgi:hypothetical protein
MLSRGLSASLIVGGELFSKRPGRTTSSLSDMGLKRRSACNTKLKLVVSPRRYQQRSSQANLHVTVNSYSPKANACDLISRALGELSGYVVKRQFALVPNLRWTLTNCKYTPKFHLFFTCINVLAPHVDHCPTACVHNCGRCGQVVLLGLLICKENPQEQHIPKFVQTQCSVRPVRNNTPFELLCVPRSIWLQGHLLCPRQAIPASILFAAP